jgi:hypothetical protein
VKALAIGHQVMVHAQAWLTLFYPTEVHVAPSFVAQQVMLSVGAISMTAPMTAAAVLRLNVAVDDNRIQPFPWSPYIWLCFSLMLLESCKQVWIYGWPGFFEWDALHTVALTIPIILLVGRRSIGLLWALALAIILATPILYWAIGSWEATYSAAHADPNDFNPSLLSIAYLCVFISCWGFLFGKLLQSKLDDKRKKIFGGLLMFVAVVCAVFIERIPSDHVSDMVLRTLPIGILFGSYEGYHIWGFFPWAGIIMLGFLIYDWMVRQPDLKVVMAILAIGVIALVIFYYHYSEVTIARCAPRGKVSGFNGICFNRTPQQFLLVIGCFLVLVAEGRLVELWGWENRLWRALSRSILPIYIFSTTIMQYLAQWWINHIPTPQLIWSFILFCLVITHVLALLIDRAPTDISITLRKVEAVT